MVTTQTLSQVDLFADLSEKQLADFASLCEEVTCPEGQTIFHEGDKAERLFILLEGKVFLQVQLTSRPECITVAVISQPFQAFGWSGVIPNGYYTASALCQTNSRLLALDGEKFMHELEQHPAAGFGVMRRIAEVISTRLRNSRVALLRTL